MGFSVQGWELCTVTCNNPARDVSPTLDHHQTRPGNAPLELEGCAAGLVRPKRSAGSANRRMLISSRKPFANLLFHFLIYGRYPDSD